jgi:hypothetical protein
MNIKRIESEGSYSGSGDAFDSAGNSVGRADLTVQTHRRILDAGTHQEPDAELRGILRGHAHIEFEEDAGRAAGMAALFVNADLTLRLDDGPSVHFQMVNDRGDINIRKVE